MRVVCGQGFKVDTAGIRGTSSAVLSQERTMTTEKRSNFQASTAPEAPGTVERLSATIPKRKWNGPTCTATNKQGQVCGSGATISSGRRFCFHHDPEIAPSVKLAAVTRGGLIATRQYALPDAPDPDLSSPDQIEKAIKETAGRVTRGELAPSVAVALTGLFNAALRSYEMSIARRLADLEALAASRARAVQGTRLELQS
jgi:hypothetical protein